MLPLLEHRIVTQDEMDRWPVDRARSGEKCWAETTWGSGPLEPDAPRKLLYNWNTWPCRIVIEAPSGASVVRASAAWRRSKLSIRMKGLKLLSAKTGREIADARVVRFDQEGVVVEFDPVDGAGEYHLYYGAHERVCFSPTADWTALADRGASEARAVRIEARCKAEDFDAMETVALPAEVDALLARHAGEYLVFPEDRDRVIKLRHELPVDWAVRGPSSALSLVADRHEYRVFQLGLWAARKAMDRVSVTAGSLRHSDGKTTIPAKNIQCVTLESRIKSKLIAKPKENYTVPAGQVRALWLGIDIPQNAKPGEYRGEVTVSVADQPSTRVAITLSVSDTIVPERGDHDAHRMSRLRWLESDVGMSDKVYAPFKPLKLSRDSKAITTWGHKIGLATTGLPGAIDIGGQSVLAGPVRLSGVVAGKRSTWPTGKCTITDKRPGFVEWRGVTTASGVQFNVIARMEYDGSILYDLELLPAGKPTKVRDLTLEIPWRKELAQLATGMGYRGRREGDRSWRFVKRGAMSFSASLWMGSISAGLGFTTWLSDSPRDGLTTDDIGNAARTSDAGAWEDPARSDAAMIVESDDAVTLRLNLGAHKLTSEQPWRMRFALLPTPVKPPDKRHWQFRYMHKGGGMWPSDTDTPQSYLKDECKRLDAVANKLGVTRLNLHDWWGPIFNYAKQWEGPDNLSRLTKEAHKRGVFVKVYNSGREISNFAPEMWAILEEGVGKAFPDTIDPNPRLWFQDAWRQNHLPDGAPSGWPRLHTDLGNEHCIPVSNATRNGNFYLESMKYMTRFFGTDGAYWDGADGPTMGHREMAKRLFVIFKQHNPHAATDVHHGHALVDSPVASLMLCFPFIDSLWHGEGFEEISHDPWSWLVEIAALPFGVPSEMLGMDAQFGRGMLFGIWPRHGWYAETDRPAKLWRFFDHFGIEKTEMLGWWLKPMGLGDNGVTPDRPNTMATAFVHPKNGVLLAVASWHPPLATWLEMAFDVSLHLDRRRLGLPAGALLATDILSGEEVDIGKPLPLPDGKLGRLIWVRSAGKASS